MLCFWKEIVKPPQDCTVLCGFQRIFLCTLPSESETGSLGGPACLVYRGAGLDGPRGSSGCGDKEQARGRSGVLFSPQRTGHILLED